MHISLAPLFLALVLVPPTAEAQNPKHLMGSPDAGPRRLRPKGDARRSEIDSLESYYWKLYAQNNKILNELKERFRKKNIEFPRPESVPPGFSAVEIERYLEPSRVVSWDDEEQGCTSDKTIIERLLKDYKSFKTPSENGVIVWLEVWVQTVNSINEITSDFDMDIYVTELWMDYALRYDHMNPCKYNLSLSNEILEQIWKPNTVFINSKEAHIHRSPFVNVFLMIYPNGTVWINYRVQVKGPCTMDFSSFPFERHSCQLTVESFSYNNQEVNMRWLNTTSNPLSLMNSPIVLPDFVLTNYSTSIENVVYPAGVWNELTMTFEFSRRYGWYIFQAYIPTYLTIFISWISFCLGSKMIPARTMLGVNSLLALTFQFGNIMRNLPRVSYVKALDVWMLSCLTFVFCSLLELALVGSMSAKSEARGPKTSCSPRSTSPCPPSSPRICKHSNDQTSPHGFRSYGSTSGDPRTRKKLILTTSGSLLNNSNRQADRQQERMLLIEGGSDAESTPNYAKLRMVPSPRRRRRPWTTDDIDRISICAFPTLFGLFNIIYWSYYLTRP
ncbi:hypothetical protein QR680_017609 [Steinernema hermaphroditum]|uniref:Uncharacterized protein n=1 Tax=Steinernema hermaphroditum TaxID=289476 RepID=A0AA39HF74_9BILA|nr:hypothetical protein QR680_017609 [Steinernema hermaphroditum]